MIARLCRRFLIIRVYCGCMRVLLSQRDGYSRAEYLTDMTVHIAGCLAALGCVPVLIWLSLGHGAGPAPTVGTALYGFGFMLMISASALYNIFPHPDWDWLLKRLDHSAIYVKIAATVTGFAFIAGQGGALVAALWATAAAGISLKLVSPYKFRRIGLILYVGMGWVGALAGWKLLSDLPQASLVLTATGGLIYTGGVGVYLWDRLPFHNAIWHVCVLVASLMIYAALVIALTS